MKHKNWTTTKRKKIDIEKLEFIWKVFIFKVIYTIKLNLELILGYAGAFARFEAFIINQYVGRWIYENVQ